MNNSSSYLSFDMHSFNYFLDYFNSSMYIRQLLPIDKTHFDNINKPSNCLVLVQKEGEYATSKHLFYVKNRKLKSSLLNMQSQIDLTEEFSQFHALQNNLLSLISFYISISKESNPMYVPYVDIIVLYARAYELFALNRRLQNLDCDIDKNWL